MAEKKNKGGRKSKIDAELIEKASTLVRSGCFNDTVAHFLGISPRTLYNWMEWGREAQEKEEWNEYRHFYERMRQAESHAEASCVMGIFKAGKRQWQAFAWYLERKYPDRWGFRKRKDEGDDRRSPLDDLVDELGKARKAREEG